MESHNALRKSKTPPNWCIAPNVIGTEYNKVKMPIMNWQTIANKSSSILKFMGF